MKNIEQLLQSFRDDLPENSQAAAAIDRGARLEEISELAEAEGFHKFASAPFEAEQEALREGPEATKDAATATESFLREARKASWEEISELAEKEGLHRIASVLFEVEQERLHTPG